MKRMKNKDYVTFTPCRCLEHMKVAIAFGNWDMAEKIFDRMQVENECVALKFYQNMKNAFMTVAAINALGAREDVLNYLETVVKKENTD